MVGSIPCSLCVVLGKSLNLLVSFFICLWQPGGGPSRLLSLKNLPFSCKECSELTASWCSSLQDRPPFSSQAHSPCSLYRWLSLDQFQWPLLPHPVTVTYFISPLLSPTQPELLYLYLRLILCFQRTYWHCWKRWVGRNIWSHRIQIDIHTHMHTQPTQAFIIHISLSRFLSKMGSLFILKW